MYSLYLGWTEFVFDPEDGGSKFLRNWKKNPESTNMMKIIVLISL